MRKIFAALVLAFALMIGNQASAATEAVTFADRYNFVNVAWFSADAIVDPYIDFLALRTGPSTGYTLITRIPPGARIRVEGYSGDTWLRVYYRGMSGYSHGRYIAIIPNTVRY